MKQLLTLILTFMLSSLQVAAKDIGSVDGVTWRGDFIQGGLVIGKFNQPGSSILVDGSSLKISDDGYFVFGYGRDAGPDSTIVITYRDGKKETLDRKVEQRQYNIQYIEGISKSIMSPSQENIERSRKENRMVGQARKTDSPRLDFLQQFIWPASGPISGVYGSQRVYNGVPKRPHFGVDVAIPTGTAIVAPADGVVTLAHPDMFYSGGTLVIDHGHGVSSTMIHLDEVVVKVGDEIKQGDLVARSGASGRATGPHLDWRLNWFNTRLDPELLVPPMVASE